MAMLVVVGVSIHFSSRAANSGPPAGYSMVWQDEFNGSSLDLSKWNYFVGQGAAPDINFTKDAVSVADGSLNLTTFTENGIHQAGHIQSDNKYQPKFGYLEARISFAYPDNVGGAFWLMHPTVNIYDDPWNHGVETDIVEYAKRDWQQKDISNQAISSINWGQYGPDWDNHPSTGSPLRGSGLASGTHTYAVEWTPTTLKYYIDGQYMYQINDSTVTPVSRRDMYLILDQYPASGPVNYGNKTTSTAKMKVDYVRVYQLNPTVPPAPTNLTTSGGSGNTTINWSLAANATKYNIKRASTRGAYALIGSTSELTFTDTAGTPGATYVVTALNSVGESSNSVAVLTMPNLALHKSIVASTARQAASNATDGSPASFWESDWNKDPQWAYVDLKTITVVQRVLLNWELAYAKSYSIEVSQNAISWTKVYATASGNGGLDEIAFTPQNARYIRVTGTERAHPYANPSPFGYALKEFEVYGYNYSSLPAPTDLAAFPADQSVKLSWTPAAGVSSYTVKRGTSSGGPYTVVANVNANSYTDTGLSNGVSYYHIVSATNSFGASNETTTTPKANLAAWAQTYNSSKENTDTQPFKAVDGKLDTFNGLTSSWASAFSENQWYCIELPTQYSVNRAVINWDYMYAKAYDLQVSNDAVNCQAGNWTTVYSTTSGTGGVSNLSFAPIKARYVRMLGKQRGTIYGYSIKEFEVYGQ